MDTCAAAPAKAFLIEHGHDVVWIGDEATDPGDEAILARAKKEGSVLVTLDKDFGELAIVRRLPHRGIVRLVGLASTEQGPMALAAAERYSAELADGAIVTVSSERVRIRPADA